MIRPVKILFMLSIAAWGILGAIANLMAYPDGYYSVEFTFSMQGAPNAPGLWRAIENPLLIHLGFAVLWGSKLAAGLLSAYGTLQLWKNRNASAKAFNEAKVYGLVGAAIALIMLFFGFVVISGPYFELWRDVETMGYEAHVYAFIYFGCIGILTLFIAQPEVET